MAEVNGLTVLELYPYNIATDYKRHVRCKHYTVFYQSKREEGDSIKIREISR